MVLILSEFTTTSGQKINLQRSGITFGKGISPVLSSELATILNIPIWDSPGKYLGIPAEWETLKIKLFNGSKRGYFLSLKGGKSSTSPRLVKRF